MQHHSNKKQKTVKKSVLHKWQIHQLDDDPFYFCGFNFLNLLLKNIEWINIIISFVENCILLLGYYV